MKRLTSLAVVALTASVALTGCMQPVEFAAAPETMPAVEPQDMPSPSVGFASWNTNDIEYFGASSDLEKNAHDSAKAVQEFSEMNPDSLVAQLSVERVSAKQPGHLEFMISNDLTKGQMKATAKATTCAILETMPETPATDPSRLTFFRLISTTASEVVTFSDTQLCE